jgi:hypothetical protein
MENLKDCFEQKVDKLQRQLLSARTKREAVSIILKYIAEMSEEADCFNKIPERQQRPMADVLAVMRAMLEAIEQFEAQVTSPLQPTLMVADQDWLRQNQDIRNEPVGGAVRSEKRGFFAEIVDLLLGHRRGKRAMSPTRQAAEPVGQDHPVTAPAPVSPPSTKVDLSNTLNRLRRAFEVGDKLIARAVEEPVREKQDPSLADHGDVLELLQAVWGEMQRTEKELPTALQMNLERIPTLLLRQGIRLETYNPERQAEKAYLYFDMEPSLNPTVKEYVTLEPALLQGDVVLRRGRVVEPNFG